MIPRKHKLTGKDINYMLRKGRRIHGKLFSFLVIDQYRNNEFHQRGVHISIKISKKATVRNEIKRRVYAAVRECDIGSQQRKIFVNINKKSLPQILTTLARLEKNAILQYRKKGIASDLLLLKGSGARHHTGRSFPKQGRRPGTR